MRNQTIDITRAQAKAILKASFPDYRGRKIRIEFTESVTFTDLHWGGGSRNYYVAIRADGKRAPIRTSTPWDNPVEGKTVHLPDDVLVVEHTIFCGTDCGIRIYASLSHLPKWLPAE